MECTRASISAKNREIPLKGLAAWLPKPAITNKSHQEEPRKIPLKFAQEPNLTALAPPLLCSAFRYRRSSAWWRKVGWIAFGRQAGTFGFWAIACQPCGSRGQSG